MLAQGLKIQPGEGAPALTAGMMFFLLLASLMLLRPVRDALGLAHGIESNRRLFLITVALTLVVTPVFGWVASRIPRPRLLATVFRACALLLLLYCAGLAGISEPWRGLIGASYYVFHSVFNLLVVSLFWAFMADHFRCADSKRLFPPIALGGSLGAILGSMLSWHASRHWGILPLFVFAALLLELSVRMSGVFVRLRPFSADPQRHGQAMGGSWLAGVKAVYQSPYVRRIGGYVLLNGLFTTFLYFTGLRLVAAAGGSTDHQALLFARLNFWTQMATLLAQAFLAGRIMGWLGVGAALACLPAVGIGGAAILAIAPSLMAFTLVNAIFRATQQGIVVPAQETLYTVLNRQEKYKAKAFLDTFGYRTGDATGAYVEGAVAGGGLGLLPFASTALGLGVLWLGLGVFLGRFQKRVADSTSNLQEPVSQAASGPTASRQ